MSRLFAIGDIHGCSQALQVLIQSIDPQPEDIVVTLGDLVDRGPDTRGVIDQLIELSKRTQFVGLLGNHEEMMLEVVRGQTPPHRWLRYGGVDTLDSYGFDGDLDFLPADHVAFFGELGDYFENDDYFFTHGGYSPELPLGHQDPERLRWTSLRDLVPGPHYSGKTAVVGHTANHEGEVLDFGHLVCIDTYCYGGGWLTAMECTTRHFYQANEQGQVQILATQPPGD